MDSTVCSSVWRDVALPANDIVDAAAAADAVARAWDAWHRFERNQLSRGGLMSVHAANKYLLMAHDPSRYRQLGQIAAAPPSVLLATQVERYREAFAAAMATPAGRGGHTNALQHMAGYLRGAISPHERAEVTAAIHDYHQGMGPLARPLCLIARHARVGNIEYLLRQTYLPISARL